MIRDIFRNNSIDFISIRVVLYLYIGILIGVSLLRSLPTKDILYAFLTCTGWLLAIIILGIQLTKSREDNLSVQKKQIKKSIENEAFKEINKAISELSITLSSIYAFFQVEVLLKAKLHAQSPDIFIFNKEEIGIGIFNGSRLEQRFISEVL
ncbi:MAG: hypothetical protein JW743_06480 [Deltaproteobacteria bacterium]|nr:hypothetical protein [Deltaproteobacteria bacterium]MBN2846104.1 hypothetical protein [Deltaproteobacteria bacterium]